MHRTCWICGEGFSSGFTLGVLISTCGRGKRKQNYRLAAQICEKCAKSPGGRRTRSKLWMTLRDAARLGIAHIESSREVLTLSEKAKK